MAPSDVGERSRRQDLRRGLAVVGVKERDGIHQTEKKSVHEE
jgi:hypothetical protein